MQVSVVALGEGNGVESGSDDKSPASLEKQKSRVQKFVGLFKSSKKEEHATSQEQAPDNSEVANKPEDTPGTVEHTPAVSNCCNSYVWHTLASCK